MVAPRAPYAAAAAAAARRLACVLGGGRWLSVSSLGVVQRLPLQGGTLTGLITGSGKMLACRRAGVITHAEAWHTGARGVLGLSGARKVNSPVVTLSSSAPARGKARP